MILYCVQQFYIIIQMWCFDFYLQIDILEEDAIINVVILQTVLEEIRHKSSNVYKKLRNIIKDPKRKFFVFINEHHRYVRFITWNIMI